LPNISKAGGGKKQQSNRTSNLPPMLMDEDEPDVDDDGNPLTVAAAQRIYHGNSQTLYCPKPNYDNPIDSLN